MLEETLIHQTLWYSLFYSLCPIMKSSIHCWLKKTQWFWLIGSQELKALDTFLDLVLSWCSVSLYRGSSWGQIDEETAFILSFANFNANSKFSGRLWAKNVVRKQSGVVYGEHYDFFSFPCYSSRAYSSLNWLIGHIWVCFHKNIWAIWCPPSIFFPCKRPSSVIWKCRK